jgi:hypothetical protein
VPIPKNALPGDQILHRDGSVHTLAAYRKETSDGRSAWQTGCHRYNLQYVDGTEFQGRRENECIQFIRKSQPIPKRKKPALTWKRWAILYDDGLMRCVFTKKSDAEDVRRQTAHSGKVIRVQVTEIRQVGK